MSLERLNALLHRAREVKVACLGDLMLDRYVYGDVSRISPEAPIPVMAARSDAVMLGGVGNVARNVASLGGLALLGGGVGQDAAAAQARALIASEGRMEGALVAFTDRPTSVKTRFVAAGQQLLRLDEESDQALAASDAEVWKTAALALVERAKVVVLSDYAKGAITQDLAMGVVDAARAVGAAVIVDPKGLSFAKYGGVDLIKPNAKELALVTGLPVSSDPEVEAALTAALQVCAAKAILVTRAGDGMSLAVRGHPVVHFGARARAVFDVSGAGDTAIAALALALGAGADLTEAAGFAILASGVVVGKLGTAVVTPQELVEYEMTANLAPTEAKLAGLSDAAARVAAWKAQGLKVGFTNGCFDILHRGHIAYLAQARGWCDRLVVALNSDASVRRLKGETRPVNGLDSRALVVAGLASVDLVTMFDEETPIDVIGALQPDVLVKGADYRIEDVVGGDLVKAYGGEVRLADLVEGYSTTAAIRRMTGDA